MAANYGGFDWSSDPQMALRLQLAKGLMTERRAPAQSLGENIANLGSDIVGALTMKRVLDEGKGREQAANATLATALQAGQGRAAETRSYGDGSKIDWNEQKASPALMASLLAGNKDTAKLGTQVALSNMDNKAKAEAELAKALREREGRRDDARYTHGLNLERDAAKGYDLGGGARFFPDAPGAAPSQAAPAANGPPTSLGARVAGSESGGQGPGVVNRQGFSGKYQFGEAAAAAAGFYTPDDNPNDNKWNGTFKGLNGVNTYQDFLQNEGAQDQAWRMHETHLDAEIEGRGLGSYVGRTVGGVPITRDALIGMMQIGGPAGTEKFLKTNGAYNPGDSNGTKISDYGMKFGGGVQPATQPPVQVADNSGAIPVSAGGPERVTINGRSGTVVRKPGGEAGGPFDSKAERLQLLNTVYTLESKALNGDTLTTQEQWLLDTAKDQLQQPRTMMTEQGLAQVPGTPVRTMREPQPAPATETAPNPAGAAPAPATAQTPPANPEVRIIQPKAPKPIPEGIQKGMAENVTALRKIEDALAAIAKAPDATGAGVGAINAVTPNAVTNFLFPGGVNARALIADIGSLKIHDRSGAAVSVSEFPRLAPFIPAVSDSPAVIKDKLDNFRREYINALNDANSEYGADRGYSANTTVAETLKTGRTPRYEAPVSGADPNKPKSAASALSDDEIRRQLGL